MAGVDVLLLVGHNITPPSNVSEGGARIIPHPIRWDSTMMSLTGWLLYLNERFIAQSKWRFLWKEKASVH